jgi:hypothetical protein
VRIGAVKVRRGPAGCAALPGSPCAGIRAAAHLLQVLPRQLREPLEDRLFHATLCRSQVRALALPKLVCEHMAHFHAPELRLVAADAAKGGGHPWSLVGNELLPGLLGCPSQQRLLGHGNERTDHVGWQPMEPETL